MNMNVLRVNKRRSHLFFNKSHFLRSGFFLFLVVLFGGCQSTPDLPLKKMSALDSRYRLEQKIKNKTPTSAVRFYREGLAQTLYSHCRWFPSDSGYAQLAQNRCGSLKGGVMAFSRFLNESDATQLGYPVIINHGHLESVDFFNECWL